MMRPRGQTNRMTLRPALMHEQLIRHRSVAASDWLKPPSTEGDLTFDRVYFGSI